MADLATQYFIKAKDNYPYSLEESLESLDYALSYNYEHAGAHCLMARYYSEQAFDNDEAIYHFQQALLHDLKYVETYYFYSSFLIQLNEFEKANRLIDYAQEIKGICWSCMLQRKALIFEKQGSFKKSKKMLKKAMENSVHNDEIDYLKKELKRVRDKIENKMN